jgi:hypothetical protein
VHDQHTAVVEVHEQILRAPADAQDLAPLEPLGEARRQRKAQVPPPLLDIGEALTLQHRLEAEAHRLDLGKLRHGPALSGSGIGLAARGLNAGDRRRLVVV